MSKESERMRQLKENFMQLHEEGYTIPQIAEQYNLSFAAVYGKLQEIAEANNLKRKDLLQHEKALSERSMLKAEERRMKVDAEELQKGFNDAVESIDNLISKIDVILESEKQEENNNDN